MNNTVFNLHLKLEMTNFACDSDISVVVQINDIEL